MKSKAEEIMDAWVECRKAWEERDGHLETIRETFRVLESRGQAPDDNAPLEVTVRRVLDHLDGVTAERGALKADRDLHERRAEHFQAEFQRAMKDGWSNIAELAAVTAERDVLKCRVELLEAQARADATAALYVGTERDALKAELAALRKRIADAPHSMLYPRDEGEKTRWVAHLTLEDTE